MPTIDFESGLAADVKYYDEQEQNQEISEDNEIMTPQSQIS